MNSESYTKYWQIFKKSFTVDTSEQPIYLITRSHVGSLIALSMAVYNTFLLRQRIIKNAIYITKSKNPTVVKGACIVVGSMYFSGLYVLWHIPSFFSEIAVRVYCSTEDAVTNFLMRDYIEKQIFSDDNLKIILEGEGLKI